MIKYCECGCSRIVKSPDKRGRIRKFIRGHNAKWDRDSFKKFEVSEKISRANKGKHYSQKTEFKKGQISWNKGKKCPQISQSLKGKSHSKETKQKMRLKKLKNPSRYWLGKRLSEETKRKISEAKKNPSEETIKKMRRARSKQILPTKDTSIEIKIQNFLKELNISFFTHQYIKEIKHGYQCDIFIPSKNLVIECDGDYWHKYPTGTEIDYIRTSEMIEKGFKVLRLWEIEIRKMELNEFKERLIYATQ